MNCTHCGSGHTKRIGYHRDKRSGDEWYRWRCQECRCTVSRLEPSEARRLGALHVDALAVSPITRVLHDAAERAVPNELSLRFGNRYPCTLKPLPTLREEREQRYGLRTRRKPELKVTEPYRHNDSWLTIRRELLTLGKEMFEGWHIHARLTEQCLSCGGIRPCLVAQHIDPSQGAVRKMCAECLRKLRNEIARAAGTCATCASNGGNNWCTYYDGPTEHGLGCGGYEPRPSLPFGETWPEAARVAMRSLQREPDGRWAVRGSLRDVCACGHSFIHMMTDGKVTWCEVCQPERPHNVPPVPERIEALAWKVCPWADTVDVFKPGDEARCTLCGSLAAARASSSCGTATCTRCLPCLEKAYRNRNESKPSRLQVGIEVLKQSGLGAEAGSVARSLLRAADAMIAASKDS